MENPFFLIIKKSTKKGGPGTQSMEKKINFFESNTTIPSTKTSTRRSRGENILLFIFAMVKERERERERKHFGLGDDGGGDNHGNGSREEIEESGQVIPKYSNWDGGGGGGRENTHKFHCKSGTANTKKNDIRAQNGAAPSISNISRKSSPSLPKYLRSKSKENSKKSIVLFFFLRVRVFLPSFCSVCVCVCVC